MTSTPQQPTPVAVVTGASTGIGRAFAQILVEQGFDVVIAADEELIHTAADELRASGRRVEPVQVDLATAEGVGELYDRVRARTAAPAAAVLNAGVGVGGRFDRTSVDDDLRLVDLNVRSTVHLAKLLVRDMVGAGSGRLLLTSSIAAVMPGPYHATYAASKAFVHSFAEGIREELKETGVSVTSLLPGPTETEFFSRAGMEETKLGRMDDKDDPRKVAQDGYEAMMAGRSSVVAGSLRNRLQAELGTHLPDALATPLLARLTKPQD